MAGMTGMAGVASVVSDAGGAKARIAFAISSASFHVIEPFELPEQVNQ